MAWTGRLEGSPSKRRRSSETDAPAEITRWRLIADRPVCRCASRADGFDHRSQRTQAVELLELETRRFEQTLVVVQGAQFAADSDQRHDVDIERPLARLGVVHDIVHDDEPSSGSQGFGIDTQSDDSRAGNSAWRT